MLRRKMRSDASHFGLLVEATSEWGVYATDKVLAFHTASCSSVTAICYTGVRRICL